MSCLRPANRHKSPQREAEGQKAKLNRKLYILAKQPGIGGVEVSRPLVAHSDAQFITDGLQDRWMDRFLAATCRFG